MRSGPVTGSKSGSLAQVIANGGGCYIGLDTLSDPDVGRAMGQMILADLASLAGKSYNFSRDKSRFINVFVDEASEVANEQLIQLLNKGRGAGMRLFVATQTVVDKNKIVTAAEMETHAGQVAGLLKTLAHPVRLMLACALAEGEYAVGELEAKLGNHQPTLSQQLGVLREAGIVETRRDAKQIFYRLTEEKAAQLIAALYTIFCKPEDRP